MKISPIRRSIVAVLLVLWAVGCTAPAGGASAVPTGPAESVAPSASPVASDGGGYGDESVSSEAPSGVPSDDSYIDPYVDEYATPAP